MRIILGSQSRQRKNILEEMGFDFDVMPAGIDEKAVRHDNPKDLVIILAHAKADALLVSITEPALLITSDQVVVCNNVILEKPESKAEAREFLTGYNQYPAQTVTGVVVTNTKTGQRAGAVDVAKVYFKGFSAEEINELVQKGDVFDYAGGFTIADKWMNNIERIEGAQDSVLGLPKEVTQRLIDQVS